MKTPLPHYLSGNSGGLLTGNRTESKLRNHKGQNPYNASRDTDIHQVRIYKYILSAARFLTHNSSIRAPGERGRPRAGEEHTSTNGFICACVAASAYLALLTGNRPAEEKTLFRDANPEAADREAEAMGPGLSHHYVNTAEGLAFFRKSAIALFGVEVVTKLERDFGTGEPGPRLPSFMDADLDAFSQTEWQKAYDSKESRPIRDYLFSMPAHVMDSLNATYRVKWGSQAGFLQRAFFHLASLTNERDHEWRKSLAVKPGMPVKDPMRNVKIDWDGRGGRGHCSITE